MTLTQYVAQRIKDLGLMTGLNPTTEEGKIALTCRILLRLFRTDGVLYEGESEPDIRSKFELFQFYIPELMGKIDFPKLLARYYTELAKEKSMAAAEAWYRSLSEELEPYLSVPVS